MASPVLESFCCMFNTSGAGTKVSDSAVWGYHVVVAQFTIITYNSLCIMSSSVSICGAIYQLWPRPPNSRPKNWRDLQYLLRQNSIICWLTLADILSSIGILIRSSVWLSGYVPNVEPNSGHSEDFAHIFCAVISAWIQYFYICTYWWTFIFALDTFLLTLDRKSHMVLYHMLCWGISALFCFVGVFTLYYPELRCSHDPVHLVPHYLSTYLPMLTVMLVNPVLYVKSSKAVLQSLRGQGVYTDREREISSAVKRRFLSIMFVFYACWIPNIINGLLLVVRPHIVPDAVYLAMWHIMAFLNPLQAFLNSLVYRGIGMCPQRYLSNVYMGFTSSMTNTQANSLESSSESSALLSFQN